MSLSIRPTRPFGHSDLPTPPPLPAAAPRASPDRNVLMYLRTGSAGPTDTASGPGRVGAGELCSPKPVAGGAEPFQGSAVYRRPSAFLWVGAASEAGRARESSSPHKEGTSRSWPPLPRRLRWAYRRTCPASLSPKQSVLPWPPRC